MAFTLLSPRFPPWTPLRLLSATCCWGEGLVFYFAVMGRLSFSPTRASAERPPYGVNMGARVITALAGPAWCWRALTPYSRRPFTGSSSG